MPHALPSKVALAVPVPPPPSSELSASRPPWALLLRPGGFWGRSPMSLVEAVCPLAVRPLPHLPTPW